MSAPAGRRAWGAAVAALLLLVLGFFPLANWIPEGLGAPWYGAVARDLAQGGLLALGIGVLVAMLGRRRPGGRPRPGQDLSPRVILLASILSGLLALLIARGVLSARPLLIDEIIQVYQARILAGGELWRAAPAHPEFFSSFHLVELDGRVFGQFPMGGPALLALGTLLGAEWVVNPLFWALAVGCFGLLLRRIEPRPRVALGALLLFAAAPFALFMAGSHMNHVTALAFLLLACGGLARAVADAGRVGDGFLTGLGLGLAATIRPVDALAFALPAGAWLAARAVRRRDVRVLLGAGAGLALPIALLAWTNLETTGAPFRFGYSVLWGAAHDLGFHATPWGPVHTPLRGLELLNLYFLRLQSYLFEAAGPSLLPATLALALVRRVAPFDRYLLAAGGLLSLAYFAYWHDGFYLGPRFLYPLLPLLALWTARAPAALAERLASAAPAARRFAVQGFTAAGLAALALGWATALPLRTRQYRDGLVSLRWDADRAAAAAGVRDALVLVRESWGAELVARMWALGVPRPDTDALYRAADPCRLELALDALERAGMRGLPALAALEPLRADSVRLVRADELTGDPSLRLTPGAPYPPRCRAKLAQNLAGFTLFPPLLLARAHGNVYARDLGPRDSLLLAEHPGRAVYLLRPRGIALGAEPRFEPLDRDSLRAAWRGGTP